MITFCIIFCISLWITSMFLDSRDDDNFLKIATIISLVLTMVFTLKIFSNNGYTSEIKKQEKILTDEKIYSLNDGGNNVVGSFVLGTGSINSIPQYSYFIKNSDGSKEKKYISSVGTKIFETNNKEPEYVETECISGKYYDFVTGIFSGEDEKEKCDYHIKRILYVPEKTVVLEFNLK